MNMVASRCGGAAMDYDREVERLRLSIRKDEDEEDLWELLRRRTLAEGIRVELPGLGGVFDVHHDKKCVMNATEPPKAAPKEPVFTCAICWGKMVDETSTICGHIFCQGCIKAAIQAQKKCPTCRRSLTMKNIHRVFLPSSN